MYETAQYTSAPGVEERHAESTRQNNKRTTENALGRTRSREGLVRFLLRNRRHEFNTMPWVYTVEMASHVWLSYKMSSQFYKYVFRGTTMDRHAGN